MTLLPQIRKKGTWGPRGILLLRKGLSALTYVFLFCLCHFAMSEACWKRRKDRSHSCLPSVGQCESEFVSRSWERSVAWLVFMHTRKHSKHSIKCKDPIGGKPQRSTHFSAGLITQFFQKMVNVLLGSRKLKRRQAIYLQEDLQAEINRLQHCNQWSAPKP